MELKDRVKQMRTKRKWTIEELSKRSGLSISMIGSIEKGSRNASKKSIKMLASAFNCSEDYLEYGEDRNSILQDFINSLIDEGIIKDSTLDDETRDMVLKAVETEIALLLKRKKMK